MMPSYMSEAWFALLRSRVDQPGAVRAHIAKLLGIGPAALSQVLNASGQYGTGAASTERIANRVIHTFGRYECPHLTDEAGGVAQVITAEQCRSYAHRAAPTAPREMKHWQACHQCKHMAMSAPPTPRALQPRKTIPIALAHPFNSQESSDASS